MADFGTTYLYGFTGTSVNKEDVLDMIINIDPFETPLLNMAPKVPANHTTVEWLKDVLSATATAGRAEGQAFTEDDISAAARATNHTQIFGKHVLVSETQQAVNPYGFTDTFLYEVMKGTREVMRNIESRLFAASGSTSTGSGTSSGAMSARNMKSLQDFLTSNNFHVRATGIGGNDHLSSNSATSLNEAEFNGMLENVWDDGGNPNFVFTAAPGKRTISAFAGQQTGSAAALTININASENQIQRAINTYISDFGLINIVLDRWVPKGGTGSNLDGTVFFLELPRIQIAFLRPVRFRRLAEDGDRVRGIIVGELTVKVLSQKGSGKLFGLSSSV